MNCEDKANTEIKRQRYIQKKYFRYCIVYKVRYNIYYSDLRKKEQKKFQLKLFIFHLLSWVQFI